MATLRGQNFRILAYDSTAEAFKVVGMATNCTVNLNTNTQDAGTKDDVGLASKPTVLSKSWQVQVESLNVADVGALLTAIGSLTPFTLLWDETSTNDNQISERNSFARKGQAFLSDATFNFNDREISSKNLTFSGSGELTNEEQSDYSETWSGLSYTMGQYVRLFIKESTLAVTSSVIAAARQLSLHVSLTLESATTKDNDGNWEVQEATALNYDISTTALVRSGETITSQIAGATLADLETKYNNAIPIPWLICNVYGENNRNIDSTIVSGKAIISSLQINAPNRQVATYTAQLQGYGAYTVGA